MSRLKANNRKSQSRSELFARAEEFFARLDAKDKVALIHDSDPDGVCSATIMILFLRKLGVKPSVIFASSPEEAKRSGISGTGCDKIIVLDLAPNLYLKDLEGESRLENDLLIFDHHMTYELKTENIFYVNPRLVDDSLYMPTSYLVFKYSERSAGMDKFDWVAAIGTVADYGIRKETEDLLLKFLSREDYKNVWESKFGKSANTLNAATAIIGATRCLEIMLGLKNYEEFKQVPEFNESERKFEEELEEKEKETRKNLEIYEKEKLMISFMETKYKHIGSTLSSIISREGKYRELTFILFEKRNGGYRLHGRSQNGNVNIGMLFDKLGVGGGHVQAGGGSIKASELGKFKQRLIDEIRRIYREKE